MHLPDGTEPDALRILSTTLLILSSSSGQMSGQLVKPNYEGSSQTMSVNAIDLVWMSGVDVEILLT